MWRLRKLAFYAIGLSAIWTMLQNNGAIDGIKDFWQTVGLDKVEINAESIANIKETVSNCITLFEENEE